MNNTSLSLYSTLPNTIIGFHGCDISTYKNVIENQKEMKPSTNDYDWLGNGIYFWEHNLQRAWQWAEDAAKRKNSKIKTPAVIGAVIDLGVCLNLVDSENIDMVKSQYEIFKSIIELSDGILPENKNIGNNTDLLLRNLDCAVIENLHAYRDYLNLPPFDSVRGVFIEGKPIYHSSGFMEKTHIQICIRNPNCIKGYFAPKQINSSWTVP